MNLYDFDIFLNESWVKSMNRATFIKMFKKNCNYFDFSRTRFIRKTDDTFDFGRITPAKFYREPRVSRDGMHAIGMNHALLNYLPEWSSYPSRKNAVIFANTYPGHQIEGYGEYGYIVIPFQSASVAYFLGSDMFEPESMPYLEAKTGMNILELSTYLAYIIENNELHVSYHAHNDRALKRIYDTLRQEFSKISFDMMDEDGEYAQPLESMINGIVRQMKRSGIKAESNLFDFLVDCYSPEKNSIELDSVSRIDQSDFSRPIQECWTDSDCLMVSVDVLDNDSELIELLGIK